ncbi:MAG: TIGR01459 family HAD-type hydrolase [Alphaproteobacteria bacterium]
MARYIQNIGALCDQYDYFIIDIFGVIHDGIKPFPETLKTLQALKISGKTLCLLSNSPRRAHNAAAQMQEMGIARDLYDHIVTSGEHTHEYLREIFSTPPHSSPSRGQDGFEKVRWEGNRCWVIGHYYIREVIEGLDLDLKDSPQNADFILNAIPGTSPPEVAAFKDNLKIALEKNLPMICANPDLVVHVGDTLYECAGTFAAMYEDMGGRVIYHGKPHAPVYERCYELLGQPDKSRICAIGDSLHTDIAGANNFGIDSILNLSGIHREELTPEALEGLNDQPHRPTYAVNGFVW